MWGGLSSARDFGPARREDAMSPVLVIGGGIAGLTAAVELADAGCDVILVEKSPSLGGRVARMHQWH